jgi:hypothetical protein
MLKRSPVRTLVFIWLAWAVIMLAYPVIAGWRYLPNRPDYALEWTPNETARNSQKGKIYLTEPFMNEQVSWDSEYYLSIAVAGYDDTGTSMVEVPGNREFSKNYAFFPFYPYLMKAVSVPLSLLGMTPIATATLAGVLISLFGALAAMIALYELVKEELGEDGGLRTAFYLLIFPTAFFFATVFTEGLFLGLVLWCLVFLKRGQFIPAAALASIATWTRATGAFLVIPLAVAWLQSIGWRNVLSPSAWNRQTLLRLACVFAPVGAYLVWRIAFGEPFTLIEDLWFGRSLTNFERTYQGWKKAVEIVLHGDVVQMRIYYAFEFAAVALVLAASLFTLRKYPGMALFCLAALAAGALTGAPQSLVRYVLTLPVIFVFLGRLGRNAVFDRAWTIASILLLAMQMYLFSQDMWVA